MACRSPSRSTRPAVGVGKCVPSSTVDVPASRSNTSRRVRIACWTVVVGGGGPVEPRHLTRVVDEVAGDERLLALRRDAHARVAGGVSRRRHEAHLVADARSAVSPPGRPDPRREPAGRNRRTRGDRRSRGGSASHARARAASRHQVAGAREGRHPALADERRVPADVVDVQVRAQHGIDRVGRETGGRRRFRGTDLARYSRPACCAPCRCRARVDHDPAVGVSTTSAWIDIFSRPSSVAKWGMSQGNFRISSLMARGRIKRVLPVVSISTIFVILTLPTIQYIRRFPRVFVVLGSERCSFPLVRAMDHLAHQRVGRARKTRERLNARISHFGRKGPVFDRENARV